MPRPRGWARGGFLPAAGRSVGHGPPLRFGRATRPRSVASRSGAAWTGCPAPSSLGRCREGQRGDACSWLLPWERWEQALRVVLPPSAWPEARGPEPRTTEIHLKLLIRLYYRIKPLCVMGNRIFTIRVFRKNIENKVSEKFLSWL